MKSEMISATKHVTQANVMGYL